MYRPQTVVAVIVFFALGVLAQEGSQLMITGESAGKISLGMTVAEAEKAMPGFVFKRTSDGEGVALIEVSKGGETHLIVYAGEDDPESSVDRSAKIEAVWVMSPKYETGAGVRPGMKVSDAEKKLGKLKRIGISEIESREYATFESGPDEFDYRLLNENGMAGKYNEGEWSTESYDPGAYIFSIQITGRGRSDGGPMDGSRSLMDLIIKAVGDFSEMQSRTVEIKADTADGPSKATVVVTDDGYLDDSVRGMRTTLMIELDEDGLWQIKSSEEAWRCREGRGHTDFQPKPCL